MIKSRTSPAPTGGGVLNAVLNQPAAAAETNGGPAPASPFSLTEMKAAEAARFAARQRRLGHLAFAEGMALSPHYVHLLGCAIAHHDIPSEDHATALKDAVEAAVEAHPPLSSE